MLVLSRKPGEALLLGEDIKIIVQRIDGNTVRLAISAPKSVAIFREELYEAIFQPSDPPEEDRQLPA